MKETYIKIKFKTFLTMLEYVRWYIFKNNPDADKATNPIDIPFLDYLIELKDKHIKAAENAGFQRKRDEK